MTAEQLASVFLGSSIITLGIVAQAYYWQRKEYRWDRMRAYLLGAENSMRRDYVVWAFLLTVLMGWILYAAKFPAAARGLGWIAIILACVRYGLQFQGQGVLRPELTIKSSLLLIGAVVGVLVAVGLTVRVPGLLALQLATVALAVPVIVAFVVIFVNGIAGVRKKSIIGKAKAMRRAQPALRVILITGSVGKTSAKEYLNAIIRGTGLSVAATKEHRNSEFTVAQDMLEQLPKRPDVYIVEAGAYRKGEIAAIGSLVMPTASVITAITNQHEALFGSLDALIDAKWEAVEALPKDGIAILNLNALPLQKKSSAVKQNILWYSATSHADVFMDDVSFGTDSIAGKIHFEDTSLRAKLPLVGSGALVSSLAAAAAAFALGIAPDRIVQGLESLPQLSRTLQLVRGKEGMTVLDDSYSASEASVLNAIEHLGRFTAGDARIALVPVIELGKNGPAVHERIGQALAGSTAAVYIYGTAYEQDIRRGLGNRAAHAYWFTDAGAMAGQITKGISGDTVLLLEGRLPEIIRKAVIA